MTTSTQTGPDELLALLSARGVELWLDGDRLRFRAPAGVMTDDLRAMLRGAGPALRDRLKQPVTAPGAVAASQAVVDDHCLMLLAKGTLPALFCMHSVSGGATYYRGLALEAGTADAVPALYGLCAEGFDLSRPPRTRIEDMAEGYIRQIRLVQPHGPYRLCGFSMGGLIAHEVATQLEAAGERIDFLGVFDTRLDELRHQRDGVDRAAQVHWLTFINICAGAVPPELHDPDHYFWQLDRSRKLELILAAAKVHNTRRFPSQADQAYIEQAYAFYDTMETAASIYRPAPVRSDLTYFQVMEAPDPRAAEDWAALTRGRFRLVRATGSHFSLFGDAANARALGRQMMELLSA